MTSPVRKVTYLLAERMVRRGEGISHARGQAAVRERSPDLGPTRRDLSIETVALRMFSRWQQENFFRYMRHEFALDHLPSTAVEPADPAERTQSRGDGEEARAGSVTAQLAKAEQAYGQQAHDTAAQQRRTVRGCTISHELGRTIKNLCPARGQLDAELTALPARVAETMNGEPIVRLERERKIITDTVKMVAYRAETQLANLVGPLLPSRHDEAREFMRQVFELPADLLPNYERGELVVRLHSMTSRATIAPASLCGVLNELDVSYPDTEQLRLVLEATPAATESR